MVSPNFVFKTDHERMVEPIDTIYDREWLKSTFILSDNQIDNTNEYKKWIRINRYVSSADYKFTSTSPGMNMAVNPRPQFTRYADIRSPGKISERETRLSLDSRPGTYSLGMGRYYSEAIDDNAQRIFLRFGVPQFKPLALWVSDAFDVKRAIFANSGNISKVFLQAVDIVSTVFVIASFPLLSLGAFLINAMSTDNRFYTVRPTMYQYWATVEDLLNSFVSRRTLLPYILSNWSFKLDNKVQQELTVSANFVEQLNNLIPDIVDNKGRISVFGIALKAQSAFNRMQYDDFQKSEIQNPSTDFTNYPVVQNQNSHSTYFTNRKGEANAFTAYIFKKAYDLLGLDQTSDSIASTDQANISKTVVFNEMYTDENGNLANFTVDSNNPKDSVEQRMDTNFAKKKSRWDSYKDYALAELSEGAAFAIFNVDYTGSVSESFSSSVMDNPIGTMFNSVSSKFRSVNNMLGGITSIPVLGDLIKTAGDSASIVVQNASFGLANPLLALLYGINVELPKMWDSSSASLPKGNYKIRLVSPYGNAYSQLFNIYLPLTMILAGSLPRSTGSSSHTSPFLCQLFDKGRVNVSLGIIDSVTITRGTSNLNFAKAGHPNAIDVDISITNMEEVISVDVASGGILATDLKNLKNLTKINSMTEYINTITGLDVYHQIYRLPRIRLALAEQAMKFNKYINPDPAAFAAFTVNKLPFEGLMKDILGNNAAAVVDLSKGL